MPNNPQTEECRLFILQYLDSNLSPVISMDMKKVIEGAFRFNGNAYRAAEDGLLRDGYISEAPGAEAGAGNMLVSITAPGKEFLEAQTGLVGAETARGIMTLNGNKPDDAKIAFAREVLAALGLRVDGRILPAAAISRQLPSRGSGIEGRT